MTERTILWTNNIWTITDIGNKHSLMVDNSESVNLQYHTDYPIIYDDGRVAYNFPERIPTYVKDKVENILIKKLNEKD